MHPLAPWHLAVGGGRYVRSEATKTQESSQPYGGAADVLVPKFSGVDISQADGPS